MNNVTPVADDGFRGAVAFEAVPDQWRNLDQAVVVLAQEDFLYGSARRGIRPIVIEHQLDAAKGNRVVNGHAAVAMPSFDHAGKDDGEIDFAEFSEMGIGAAEHAHNLAALVGNLQEGDYLDAFDHAGSPRKWGAGRGTANRPPRPR